MTLEDRMDEILVVMLIFLVCMTAVGLIYLFGEIMVSIIGRLHLPLLVRGWGIVMTALIVWVVCIKCAWSKQTEVF